MSRTLDSSQRCVAEAAPTERLVVVAGAGQGKTEVIAARINHLVEDGLSPGDDILVLTFSRAAVSAARQRVEECGTGAVSISTFDSFASQLLLEAGVDLSTINGFDRRVRAATATLLDGATARVQSLRHVLLDEVQDLVGDRAEFALGLLAAVGSDCGFTAMGDPLQAIYDWQLSGSTSKATSSQLLSRLESDLGARRTSLDNDYRARGPVPLDVMQLGRRVRASQDLERSRALVAEEVEDLIDLGPLEETTNLLDRSPKTTALLCRTNGDALVASGVLREFGVDHVLRRPLDELGAARWIGAALGDVDAPNIERDRLRDLVSSVAPEMDPIEAWILLKEAEGRRGDRDSLNLGALRGALRTRSTPAGLEAVDESDVTVSTIHRAKGLEFDRVLLPVTKRHHFPGEDPDAEMRVTYVALSRARDDVFGIRLPSSAAAMSQRQGRWVMTTFRGSKQYITAIELGTYDVVSTQPVVDDSGSGIAVQQLLRRGDVLGETVTAWLDVGSPSDRPCFSLRVGGDGRLVGRTTDTFGQALITAFGPRRRGQLWPSRIGGIAISAVETVAGDPSLTRDAGLAGSGLWLVVRLTGLARPDWDHEVKE